MRPFFPLFSPLILCTATAMALATGLTAMAATPAADSKPVSAQVAAVNGTPQSLATDTVVESGSMFALYEQNRKEGVPSLVTPDLLLLGYSQLRKQRIADLEYENWHRR